MYTSHDKAQLASLGLQPEDFDSEAVRVWPDNAAAVITFDAMASQWRVGMSGATGLDYAALTTVMGLRGVAEDDRAQAFEDIRTMEHEALKVMRSAHG